VTVAFVAVSLADPDLLPAGERRPGIAVLPRHERELAAALAEAGRRARCVIVLAHWGAEGTPSVTGEQRRWARWLVEQGASAVIGSGPHEVQAYETIAGVPVYYSLGNLWFRGRWPRASRTAGIAFVGLDGTGRVVASRLERVSPSALGSGAAAAPLATPAAGRPPVPDLPVRSEEPLTPRPGGGLCSSERRP
jgi:hypothetical protein